MAEYGDFDAEIQDKQPTLSGHVEPVVSEQFTAMAQGKVDYSVDVIPVECAEYGTLMCICSEGAAIYITKEQAAKFFGFAH